MVKSGQLTNIIDSVSTTNQQNLSTVKNVDLRKSHPHQQNWSIVQIVDSLLDPNQQSVSLKIGETTKCTLGFFLHNNKFVDQQSGSNVQIVVSGPTSTNCVIPESTKGVAPTVSISVGSVTNMRYGVELKTLEYTMPTVHLEQRSPTFLHKVNSIFLGLFEHISMC